MSWWPVVLPALAAAIVLLAPGALLAWAGGVRGLPLAGLAAPLSVAVVGTAGVLSALVRVPFGWWDVVVLTAVIAGGIWLVRRWLGGRTTDGTAPQEAEREGILEAHPAPALGPVLLTALAATVALAFFSFSGVPTPQRFSQTYDGVFHLNAAASILTRGDASSFDLYSLTHAGGGLEFYPSGWHSVVALAAQLTGAAIPVAANAVTIAASGAAWVLGCAWLATLVVPSTGRFGATLTASVAAALAAAFPAFPYLLLDWGTLYPTWLAYALLPSGLALAVWAARQPERLRSVRWWVLFAAWLLASVFAHPRSLATYGVLVAPLAVWLLGRLFAVLSRRARRPWLKPALWGGVLLVLAGTAAAGFAYVYRAYDLAHRPISDHLNGGPATATQTLGVSALQALLGSPPSAAFPLGIPAAVVVAGLTLAGLVLAVRTPVGRCLAVSFVALVVLYALAAGSNDDLAKLATGIWYKDKFRLIAGLPVLAVPFATGTVVALAAFARRRPAPVRRGLAIGVAGVAVAAALVSPALAAMSTSIGTVFALPSGDKRGYLTNAGEVDLLQRLPELTPPGAVIVGNPWDGSTLSWALGGRESLFPHLTGDWDPDRLTVATSLDRIADDPAVCAALDRLGAHYLLASEGLMWGGDPQAGVFAGIDRAVAAGVGTPIATEGGTTLFRIDECG